MTNKGDKMITEKELIHVCCVCQSIKDENGNYDDNNKATGNEPNASHGYCNPCFAGVMAEIKKNKKSGAADEKINNKNHRLHS